MNVYDWIIIAVVAVSAVFAVISIIRSAKKGKCPGCGNSCSGCVKKDCRNCNGNRNCPKASFLVTVKKRK